MRGSALVLILMGCAGEPFLPPTLPCTPLDTEGFIDFDPNTPLCVQVEMHAADFETLAHQQRFGETEAEQWDGVFSHVITSCSEPFPDPFTWFDAQVTTAGSTLDTVGVRKKGFIGSVLEGSHVRPSLKLKTDRSIDQAFGDTERITLNNNLTDRSRMRTCLTYSVFEDAGYPTPRCNLANVMLNGRSLGAYTHVEPMKRRFLRRAFGNDHGSLYESTVADFTPGHLEDGLGRWEAKTRDTDVAGGPLLTVIEALQAPDAELEQSLDVVIDLDAYFTFWALESLLGHRDGHTANTNNTYVYFDPDDNDRAMFIPWGPDDAMGHPELEPFVRSELSRRLSRHPELRQRYLAELQRLLDEVWDEDLVHERMDRFADQIRSIEDYDGLETALTELSTWVDGRRGEVERFIEDGGAEGGEDSDQCYSLLQPMELTATAEAATAYAHLCGSAAPPSGGLFSTLLCLVLYRRRA